MSFSSLVSALSELCPPVVCVAANATPITFENPDADVEDDFKLDPTVAPCAQTAPTAKPFGTTIAVTPRQSLVILAWLLERVNNKDASKDSSQSHVVQTSDFVYKIEMELGNSMRVSQFSREDVALETFSRWKRAYESLHIGLTAIYTLLQAYPELAIGFENSALIPVPPASIRGASMPIPYTPQSPWMKLPARVLDRQEISVISLSNALITGGTGSGKTTSVMFNMVDAAIGYSADELISTVLVVDPKAELKPHAIECAAKLGRSNDVLVVGENAPKLHAFRFHDGKSVKERIEAARDHVGGSPGDGDGALWQAKSLQFVIDVLQLEYAVAHNSGGPGLIARLFPDALGARSVSVWTRLEHLLKTVQQSAICLRNTSSTCNLVQMLSGTTACINPLATFAAIEGSMAVEQCMYVARGALSWVSSLATVERTGLVDYNPLPIEGSNGFDLIKACDEGKIIVFQPGDTEAHTTIGRLLKGQFFHAVTHRNQMLRPQFYLVDEAQRFISQDAETGEHAFLDRSRAYRCVTILSTQSIAALVASVNQRSVQAVLSHCPTKVFLRNSDPATQDVLRGCVPLPRNCSLPHITTVRPLSALRTGQAYYRLGNDWGISQYSLSTSR